MPYDMYIEDGRPAGNEEGSVEKEKREGKEKEITGKEENTITNLVS